MGSLYYVYYFKINRGPSDTPYEGGCFRVIIKYPNDYPLNPPALIFTPPIWHPNIHLDGKVCISILHPPVFYFKNFIFRVMIFMDMKKVVKDGVLHNQQKRF